MTTIALTGGGTAGHVMPSIALLSELYKYSDRIIFIGGNGIEEQIAREYELPFYSTKVVKFDRTHFMNNFKIPFVLKSAVNEAKDILKSEKVDAVFAKGGYCSIPASLAAHALGVPLIIHESDYTMGLANKMLSRYACRVLTAFPETYGGEYVGAPIRDEIFKGDANRAREKYHLSPYKKTLLVFGGSQGALAINDLIFPILNSLTKTMNVVHVVGKNEKRKIISENYVPISYANDIADLYAVGDVIVMRAGASSLAETCALGKRVIAIPLPKGTSRGDQVLNAESYAKRSAIEIIKQEEATPTMLFERIEKLLLFPEKGINRISTNARIAEIIAEEIAKKRRF